MNKVSFQRLIVPIIMMSLITSCTSLDDKQTSETVTTIQEVTTTPLSTTETLVEFDGYTITKNDDNTFNLTITQEAMEDCYYIISLMYDGQIIEFVDGEGYIKSNYGQFAGEASLENTLEDETQEYEEENEENTVTEITTMSEEEIQSLIGKDGKWTFKCVSEGTQYIEIKLINSYGDVRYKSQFTCIVDAHLEPHMYYTSINY